MISPDTVTSHSVPMRILAASLVAVGALSLSGCKVAPEQNKGPQTIAADILRESGNVVEATGVLSTPADTLANTLNATNKLKIALSEDTSDSATLIADAQQRNVVGIDKIIGASQAKNFYNSTVRSINYDTIDEFDAVKAKTALESITDPEIRREMTEYTEATITESLLLAIRAGDIEMDGIKKILDGIKPKNQAEITLLAEKLDAGSNAIDNYDSAEKIREDAADITDPQLKILLSKNATAIEKRNRKDTAYDKLVKIYDDAVVQYDELARVKTKESMDYGRIEKAEGVEIELQGLIAAHNGISEVESFNGLRPLDEPGKVIKLTGLNGPKMYIDQLTSTKPVEYEFGEIYAENGMPVIKFADGIGVSNEAIEQLKALTEDVMPMIASGMQKGDIAAIRFVHNNEGYNPYFHPYTREIHMVVPTDDSMSEDQFRTGLVHELTHALVASAFSIEGQVTDAEAAQVKNACRALSTQAYDLFETTIRNSSSLMEDVIATAQTENDRKIFLEIKKIFDEGNVAEIMEDESLSKADFLAKDLEWTMCAADRNNFGSLVNIAALKAGVDDWYKASGDLVDRYVRDYKDSSGNKAQSTYSEIIGLWIDATEKYSLWSKLNESAYVDTESWIKEYLGHSADNATEMMATITDVTLHKPEQIVEMMKGLNPTDREAVKSSILASYTILGNRHPQLRQYLNRHYEFFEAVS